MVDKWVLKVTTLKIVTMESKFSERKVVVQCSKLVDRCEERTEIPEMSLGC